MAGKLWSVLCAMALAAGGMTACDNRSMPQEERLGEGSAAVEAGEDQRTAFGEEAAQGEGMIEQEQAELEQESPLGEPGFAAPEEDTFAQQEAAGSTQEELERARQAEREAAQDLRETGNGAAQEMEQPQQQAQADQPEQAQPEGEQVNSLQQLGAQASQAVEQGEQANLAIPLHEEKLEAVKTQNEAGTLQVRKYVEEEQQTITVPVQTYSVTVRRQPVEEGSQARASFNEGSVNIPLTSEEVELQKRVVVREQLVIDAQPVTEQREITGTVRSERAEVIPQGDIDVEGDVQQKGQQQKGQQQPQQEQQEQQAE